MSPRRDTGAGRRPAGGRVPAVAGLEDRRERADVRSGRGKLGDPIFRSARIAAGTPSSHRTACRRLRCPRREDRRSHEPRLSSPPPACGHAGVGARPLYVLGGREIPGARSARSTNSSAWRRSSFAAIGGEDRSVVNTPTCIPFTVARLIVSTAAIPRPAPRSPSRTSARRATCRSWSGRNTARPARGRCAGRPGRCCP